MYRYVHMVRIPSSFCEMYYLMICPLVWNIIKIMPYVEGDGSDYQPEANSIARSQRLLRCCALDLCHPQHRALLFLLHRISIVYPPRLSVYLIPI